VRVCLSQLAAICLFVAAVHAQPVGVDVEAFAGTWKENLAKTRKSISPTLTYAFSEDDDGYVLVVRGGVQLRDRVRFDGQDHPTPEIPGRSVSWTKIADTTYVTTIKRNGSVVENGRWTLSDGGKRLTQASTPRRDDDQNVTNVMEYIRIAGEGNSLLGEWQPISSRAGEADLLVVTVIDAGALKVFYPRNKNTSTIRLDGKEYTLPAERSLQAMTTSADVLGPRAVRTTTLQAHAPIFESSWVVSSDGKTLTVMTSRPGTSEEPSVFVYEKQE
jgi:hypothetical protein